MANRRKFLASVGTIATISIAGCSDSESESEPEPEEENNDPSVEDFAEEAEESLDDVPTSETETILDQSRRRLEGGEYIYWSFEINRESELQLRTTVRDGSPLNIYLTNPNELDAFERDERFRFNNELSQENTIGEDTTVTVPPDEYILLVYNDNVDRSSVDIELVAG